MPDRKPDFHWQTLDRDLRRLSLLEAGTAYVSRPLVGLGVALLFMGMAGIIAAALTEHIPTGQAVVVIAAIFGAYMALNIGANDVANNMGPAVGANALTMGGAIAIAAICETAGAMLAGGDVVNTISSGIIAPETVGDPTVFIAVMMAALASSALWVNLATYLGAPVSTTHAVVGGVVGSGITAAGFAAVSWDKMGDIALSWIVSPVLGGSIAALLLWFIKINIVYKDDMIAAGRRWVPVLTGLMGGVFATYLAIKGLKKVVDIDLGTGVLIGIGAGLVIWLVSVPYVRAKSTGLENRKKSLKVLFGLPLIVSAGLLSFAHGANDVANAVGPLAAIVHTAEFGDVAGKVDVPHWVMIIGAFGISFGLIAFGPKLIKMVGNEITKLNPMRAYCVALSAAVTVIVASWLGLPVSSTHIAVGGVFGVGFFREWEAERRARVLATDRAAPKLVAPEERRRRKLVRRSHFMTIVAAWVITVPASALLSAIIFLVVRLFLA